ncbi:MAG: nucleotide exchange factor GrpE [Candidatus Heimdallarchaeota archaeon]|nr:MAG: nucleotide exchange factor GrpE [Candidatus Heimdallarchaeota archaeon]
MTESEEETIVSEVKEIIEALEKDSKTQKLIKELDKKLDGISLKNILVTNKKMITETEQAKKEKEEYLSLLQRFKADFENYKKRAQKQADNNVRFSSEKILSKIFDPIEDIDRAITFAKDNSQETIPLEGIIIIRGKLSRVLEEEGVAIINPLKGEKFDPYYHEAVYVDSTGNFDPGVVVQILEKGYKIKERVMLAAKVMVSAEKEETKEEEKQSE